MTEIRKAEETDIIELANVIRHAFATVAQRYNLTPENCPRHASNYSEEWVRRDLERGVTYYILETEGKSAGCMALEKADDETCYLERLAVLPDERNRGLGQELLARFIQEAGARGFKYIGIGIIEKQRGLKNWYKKLGFYETGKKSFDHLPFEVCFMQYRLTENTDRALSRK